MISKPPALSTARHLCVCVCVCSSVCGHAEATDNASVNFVKYKGDYFVSTETNYMRRVDPDSLETKEKVPPYDWR